MNKKYIKIILIVFFVGVAGLLFCFNRKDSSNSVILENACDTEELNEERASENSSNEYEKEESVSNKVEKERASSTVFVHICGEVNKPGVYEVSATSRVVDVIKVAGGLTDEAAGDSINQAMQISDSQQVYVPSKKEVKDGTVQKSSTIQNKDESTTVSSENVSDKVNINTADKTELMTLPGIGEQKAASIIEYRTANGSFDSIEAIKNVTGIKEGLFNKISKYIVVN